MRCVYYFIILLGEIGLFSCSNKSVSNNNDTNSIDSTQKESSIIFSFKKDGYIFEFSYCNNDSIPKFQGTYIPESAGEIYSRNFGCESNPNEVFEGEPLMIKKFGSKVKRLGGSLILYKRDGAAVILKDSVGNANLGYVDPNGFHYVFLHYFQEAGEYLILKKYNCPGESLHLVNYETGKNFEAEQASGIIFSKDFKFLFCLKHESNYFPMFIRCYQLIDKKKQWELKGYDFSKLKTSFIGDIRYLDSSNIVIMKTDSSSKPIKIHFYKK